MFVSSFLVPLSALYECKKNRSMTINTNEAQFVSRYAAGSASSKKVNFFSIGYTLP